MTLWDTLPFELHIEIYKFDQTYHLIYKRVLIQLKRNYWRRPENKIGGFM